jgi:hypothetical protein
MATAKLCGGGFVSDGTKSEQRMECWWYLGTKWCQRNRLCTSDFRHPHDDDAARLFPPFFQFLPSIAPAPAPTIRFLTKIVD